MCDPCDAPWPCDTVREQLSQEYGTDRVGLSMYLGAQLTRVARDVGGAPEELFERFLAWTR